MGAETKPATFSSHGMEALEEREERLEKLLRESMQSATKTQSVPEAEVIQTTLLSPQQMRELLKVKGKN